MGIISKRQVKEVGSVGKDEATEWASPEAVTELITMLAATRKELQDERAAHVQHFRQALKVCMKLIEKKFSAKGSCGPPPPLSRGGNLK